MTKKILSLYDFVGSPPTKLRAAAQHVLADVDEVQLVGRDTFSDAPKTVAVGTRLLAQVGTMSASRTVTLPAANSAPAGSELTIVDESGSVSATFPLVITRAGADTVNGATVLFMGVPYAYMILVTNGTNRWSCLGAFVAGDMGGGSPTAPLLVGTANVEAIIRANTLDQFGSPAANLVFNQQRITQLGDPVQPTDAANARTAGAWQLDPNGWTRTSNTTFTQSADTTSYLKVGVKLAWKEASVQKFGVIAAIAFATGTTTVTLATTSDYVMAVTPDAGSQYSYGNPYNFPSSFAWTPVQNGFSSGPTQLGSWWSVQDQVCMLQLFNFVAGTSNATSYTVVAPIPAKSGPAIACVGDGTDNGTATMVRAAITTGTITLTKDPGNVAWTASGAKTASFSVMYPV